jgi:hypothetical protein
MTAVRMDQIGRLLRAGMAVAVVLAAAALLWRPSLDAAYADEAAGSLRGDTASQGAAASPERAGDVARIVANNLFAASRRAPNRRYAPSDPASAPDAADAAAFDVAAADAPMLLGTVIDALGARALLQSAATDSGARFYTVGERIGTYRVRRVEAGRVTLDGPSGRIVLELLKPSEGRP